MFSRRLALILSTAALLFGAAGVRAADAQAPDALIKQVSSDVLDIASEMGLEHHYEDFGQTLGVWGVGQGAYIVWPLLGPSSVRESFALPLDRAASPALVIRDGAVKWEVTGLQIVNTRASLLGASKVLDDIALDKYTFVRDAYLQRRRSLVYDGEEPPPKDEPAPDAKPPASAPAAPGTAPAGPAASAPAG